MFDLIDQYIPAFLLGMLAAFTITSYLQHKQAKAWQLEYRRLMGGIKSARHQLEDVSYTRGYVATYLGEIYNDDPIWPRG